MTVPLRNYDPAMFSQAESMLQNSPISRFGTTLCFTVEEFLYGEYQEFPDQIRHIDSFLDNCLIDNVVFCRLGDGVEENFLSVINQIAKHYVTSGKLTLDQFAYITNIDNCSINLEKYKQLQAEYPYLPDHMCSRTNTGNIAGGCGHLWRSSDVSLSLTQYPKKKNFLCLNRGLRLPRIIFLAEMASRGLLDNTLASLDLADGTPITEQIRLVLEFAQQNTDWLNAGSLDANNLGALITAMPLSLGYDQSRLFCLNDEDVNLFNTTRVSVVNEALFHSSHRDILRETERGTFLPFSLTSEKLIKCMMLGHPFLLVSTPGHLSSLREIGYKTFGNVIDESYDQIENDHERMKAVLSEIERLNKFTDTEWEGFEQGVRDTVRFNQLLFKERAIDSPYISRLGK